MPTPNNYILNATTSINEHSAPTLANGNLAFIAYSDTIHLNGLYSGEGKESHRARIPNYGRVQFEYCGPFTLGAERCSFNFDIRRGLFQTTSQYSDNQFVVELLTFPHRVYERTIVNQLRVVRNTEDRRSFLVRLVANPGSNSVDLNLTRQQSSSLEGVNYILYELTPVTKENSYISEKKVFVLSQDVPEVVVLPEGQTEITVTWKTTIGGEMVESLAEFTEVTQQSNNLVQLHVVEWERFWAQSEVTVEGNDELAQTIHSSLYAVASALPTINPRLRSHPDFYGISPAGLGDDHYKGHTLWDTEIWIQPIALLLEPKWSEILLEYRYVTRSAASSNALRNGYVGFLYPVESAESGDELSIDSHVASHKHHVSGDVAFAVKQHLFATSDTEWFLRVGCDLAQQTGHFWENRVKYNNVTDLFDIEGIYIGCDNVSLANN